MAGHAALCVICYLPKQPEGGQNGVLRILGTTKYKDQGLLFWHIISTQALKSYDTNQAIESLTMTHGAADCFLEYSARSYTPRAHRNSASLYGVHVTRETFEALGINKHVNSSFYA